MMLTLAWGDAMVSCGSAYSRQAGGMWQPDHSRWWRMTIYVPDTLVKDLEDAAVMSPSRLLEMLRCS